MDWRDAIPRTRPTVQNTEWTTGTAMMRGGQLYRTVMESAKWRPVAISAASGLAGALLLLLLRPPMVVYKGKRDDRSRLQAGSILLWACLIGVGVYTLILYA